MTRDIVVSAIEKADRASSTDQKAALATLAVARALLLIADELRGRHVGLSYSPYELAKRATSDHSELRCCAHRPCRVVCK